MSRLRFAHNGEGTSTWIGTSQLSRAITGDDRLLFSGDSQEGIIIAIKKAANKINATRLIERGNRIILDLLDWVDYNKYKLEENRSAPNFFPYFQIDYFSGYIVNSHRQADWIRERIDASKPIFVLPRHWDSRFSEVKLVEQSDRPHIYFSGQTSRKNENCLYVDQLLANGLIHGRRNSDRYFDALPQEGCQISIRREESFEYCFKPATKLISSSAIANPIITTNDWAVAELLDPIYPYLLGDSSYETVVATIEFVNATFGGPEWALAKEMMREVKERTRVEEVAKKYLEIESYFN